MLYYYDICLIANFFYKNNFYLKNKQMSFVYDFNK